MKIGVTRSLFISLFISGSLFFKTTGWEQKVLVERKMSSCSTFTTYYDEYIPAVGDKSFIGEYS